MMEIQTASQQYAHRRHEHPSTKMRRASLAQLDTALDCAAAGKSSTTHAGTASE